MSKVKLLENIVFIFHEINIAIRLNNIHMNMIQILAVFKVFNCTGRIFFKIFYLNFNSFLLEISFFGEIFCQIYSTNTDMYLNIHLFI